MKQKIKIIVSGGGTGGHIYPAISIANALKQKHSDCEILFVGAVGKMEMEKVPAAGYDIIGLPIRGLQRSFSKENLKFFSRLLKSIWKAKAIVKGFEPDAVVGVGGYASGPLLHVAARLGVPALIQEQNSYAGITNKLLAKKAKKICVAYEGMERFFPKEKIVMTGNPVRKDLLEIESKREEAIKHFDLKSGKKAILIVGGSLGARTINNSVLKSLETISKSGVQIIWQTGKFYIEKVKKELENWDLPDVKVTDFLSRMDLAYATADIVISRAGAGTISELCLVEKACILVPSPNVSEDHQTKNAMALVNKDAAVMVKDIEAEEVLISKALELIKDEEKCAQLAKNCKLLAKPDAADDIAEHILTMI
ncbi:undecaprenyldiphospho-muramoylpentapeptide beta-N-acetylglucosaminyltransferase [Marinifilum sp.]|uniref:undecaprenyldiphospho-muramoylpentapeptide beta-N-acetylglucosaminyltransferase n=1 Tax=Marinifilum sp. TaxID=2033137 RepID=UPI003BABE6B0